MIFFKGIALLSIIDLYVCMAELRVTNNLNKLIVR